jgi:hypothetical protein
MLVKELLVTHEDYKPSQMQKHQDFYEGGDKFTKNKDKYLFYRMYERQPGPGPQAMRAARLQSASYTPHAAGLINFFVSAIMQAEPGILATGPKEKVEYYHSLNTNIDGKGQDLPALVNTRLLQMMLHHRAYFAVKFPKPNEEYVDLNSQRMAGVLDAQIYGKDAVDIDDWECADGKVIWFRTHCVEWVRSSSFGPRDREKHTWAYITDASIQEYIAYRSKEDADKDQWPEDAEAVAQELQAHELKALPIVPIELPAGLHIMNAMFPVALSLFNREASEDFALDSSAYALPVVYTKKELNAVVASELAMFKLDPTDKFEWAVPTSSHFTALASSASVKRENLFLAVQAVSIQAATKDSSGRSSGVAKHHDLSMLSTLLSAFASALKDALEKTLAAIRNARGDDDVKLEVTGLDNFDVASLELLLKTTQIFCKLPASETAKKHALGRVSLAMCKTADPSTRKQILDECMNADVSEPTPDEGPDEGPEDGDDVRVGTTQEVDGFSTQSP